ncbi:MAG: plasmid pRiA4b ORF-3 family protein [Desulfosalsimonadaceae bacterium]
MAAKSGSIYQLKITLKDSKPPIWRRVLVPGSFSLGKLHHIIQIAMGWMDAHLHMFDINRTCYGEPSPDDWEPVKNETRFRLEAVAPPVKGKFVYEYDFGDSWKHTVTVEKILPPEPGVKYPQCIAGKRACPPEDVGGVWGYEEFLEAISDPDHEEHESFMEWAGEDFDPEALDLEDINQELQQMK